jgi:hypothetical protein
MQINCSKKFIKYLDSYKNASELSFVDYSDLITNINKNYCWYNALNISEPRPNKQPFPHDCNNLTQYYGELPPWYVAFYPVNRRDTIFDEPVVDKNTTKEIDLNVPLPKLMYKHIDAKVESLSDLIDIIEKNEYDSNTEYNIDLKALHGIKENLVQINSMIGMKKIKTDILNQLIYFLQNLHVGNTGGDFKHTVIYGPPGTGKTEIAKMIGEMYSKLGILKRNVFKKVTRNDLVAGFLGQTAIKTRKVIDECMGGVLFIDEAYSLACEDHNDSFAKECIDILCEALSNHKDDLMVIVAGYKDEMEKTFFQVNKGMKSRFIWQFETEEYNADALTRIFTKKIQEQGWNADSISANLQKWFHTKIEMFKYYGRDVEALITYVKIAHGRRVYGQPIEMRKNVNMDDLNSGYDCFVRNKETTAPKQPIYGLYV